jgi:cyclically-permuted mutarotase family protein
MTKQFFNLLFYLIGLFYISPISAQESPTIKWSIAAELPPVNGLTKNPGLAGVIAGINRNLLLIGGGSNFTEGMPWQGGKKIYYDAIYILKQSYRDTFKWIKTGKLKLPQKVAYSVSVSIPGGIVCAGGENESGILKEVFLIQWNEKTGKVLFKNLPSLPIPLTNAAAVANGQIIYVAGGETLNAVSDRFFYLNLDEEHLKWNELPHIPVPISHAMMAMQTDGINNCIYLIGGRKKNPDGISDLYRSVWKFDLKKLIWTERDPLPYPLSAGCAVATGNNGIILMGGDTGKTFHAVEEINAKINAETDIAKREILNQQKINLQSNHPGFNKEILFYNTIKNEWDSLETFPFTPPATTIAVQWGHDVFIPGGEIKAGVRTAQIIRGKIKTVKNK